jgi:uncharacterized protein (DUF1330 family)
MAGYVIVELTVTDPTTFEEYRKVVGPTVEQYGGKFIVRGGNAELLEGDQQPARLVVLEFPSAERAKEWYDSEEYREPKAMRMRSSKARLLVVEGV